MFPSYIKCCRGISLRSLKNNLYNSSQEPAISLEIHIIWFDVHRATVHGVSKSQRHEWGTEDLCTIVN